MTRTLLTETSAVLVEASGAKSGRLNVQIITPGWGSSGFYSNEVLEAAATDKVFAAGTQMYLDHPTEAEQEERPGRSVKDLAAVLLEDATWNGEALVAEVRTFGPYREAVAEMADAIGVSIRASAEVSEGEADGRVGVIVEKLVEGKSVDFVTAAGRGGRILEVLESARAKVVERAVTRGVAESTANESRELLNQALVEKFGGEDTWLWVRDFDDGTVWYEHETADSAGTFQIGYSLGDSGPATLSGDPVEVRAQTTYTPITAASSESSDTQASSPAGDAATSPTAAEDTTGTTPDPAAAAAAPAAQSADIPTPKENEMTENTGAGGSAPLGSSRQVIEAQIAEQHKELVQMKAREKARGIIAEDLNDAYVAPLVVHRLTEELLVNLPIVNDELDVAALRDRVTEKRDRAEREAGELLQERGVGQPTALGSTPTTTESGKGIDLERRLNESFQTLGLSESAAGTAAKGR